jgi:hypothetical protein
MATAQPPKGQQLVTYLGEPDMLPPNQFRHPSGDILTFERHRPLAINPDVLPDGDEKQFYADVIEKVSVDPRFRVESIDVPLAAVVKAPLPTGAGARPPMTAAAPQPSAKTKENKKDKD